MDNPFLKRLYPEKIGVAGRRSEREVARRMGAKLTPSSGSLSWKGDMIKGQLMVEAKSTCKESFSVKKAWLDKVRREAFATQKIPALTVSFTTPDGDNLDTWIMIPLHTFLDGAEIEL